jgi:hypothetical protein
LILKAGIEGIIEFPSGCEPKLGALEEFQMIPLRVKKAVFI